MRRCVIFLLCVSLAVLFGFKSCEPQLLQLMPDETTSLSDPFENGTLQNPNWKWQNEPPTWDITDGHLRFRAEQNRPLWVVDHTHLLYQVVEGDFDVETEIQSEWNARSAAAGLVVKSPADNQWLALKFYMKDAIEGNQITSGSKSHIALQSKQFSWIYDVGYSPKPFRDRLCLRLAKTGDVYEAFYKTSDADSWTQIARIEEGNTWTIHGEHLNYLTLTPPLHVGIFAGVTSRGNLTVAFSYFKDNLDF